MAAYAGVDPPPAPEFTQEYPTGAAPFRPTRGTGYAALGTASFASVCLAGIYLTPQDMLDSLGAPAVFVVLGLAYLFQLATYILLSLWQVAVKRNLERQGFEGPPTWKIWAGWFIPVVNLVFPLQVMSKLNARRTVASPWLGAWWVSWLLMGFGDRAYYLVTDPDTLRILDFVISAALWLALASLVVVVVGITERHTAPAAVG